MPRKKTLTKRASYREGVEWIAANDNSGSDDVCRKSLATYRRYCFLTFSGPSLAGWQLILNGHATFF